MLENSVLNQIKLLRESVTEFDGVCTGMSREPGKITNSLNVFCDKMGVHSVPKRRSVRVFSGYQGIGSDGNLFWAEGGRLYYNGYQIDGIYLTEGEKKMLVFGGFLLIFPDGIYLSLADLETHGYLSETLTSAGSCEIKNCDSERNVIESFSLLEEAPKNASAGDFRAVRDGDGYKMLCFDGNYWGETETFIRVRFNGADGIFNQGDAVEVIGLDNNCSRILKIRQISEDYVYFSGCTADVTSRSITLKRELPNMEHVCVSGERLCGISSGYDAGGRYIRRLYASAVGNPFDFYASEEGGGICCDIIGDGLLLGITDFGNGVAVLCENSITEVTLGANKTVSYLMRCEGLSSGAEKGFAVIGDELFFKGEHGIFVYNGTSVKCISNDLGMLKNTENNSPAISYKGCYYQCVGAGGEDVLLCYDTRTGAWSFSDGSGIAELVVRRGILYAVKKGENADSCLVLMGSDGLTDAEINYCGDGIEREDIPTRWSFESGMLCFDNMKGICPEFITVRVAKCLVTANLSVLCNFETESTEKIAIPNGAGVYTFPLRKGKCDTLRVRFEGSGEFSLLGFMIGYTSESEVR